MKKKLLIIVMSLLVNFSFSQIKAVTEKGDSILIYKDGTWKESENKKTWVPATTFDLGNKDQLKGIALLFGLDFS